MVWTTPTQVSGGAVGQASDLNQYATLMAETAPARLLGAGRAGHLVYRLGQQHDAVSRPSGSQWPHNADAQLRRECAPVGRGSVWWGREAAAISRPSMRGLGLQVAARPARSR